MKGVAREALDVFTKAQRLPLVMCCGQLRRPARRQQGPVLAVRRELEILVTLSYHWVLIDSDPLHLM